MICQLIERLISNDINLKQYETLLGYLKNILRKTASKNEIIDFFSEEDFEDFTSEVVAKILSKRSQWKLIIKAKGCYSYLYTTVRNFLIDKVRERKEKSFQERTFIEFEDKEGNKQSEEDFIADEKISPELIDDILDIVDDFNRKVNSEEIKYFCYFLLPKGKQIYKCLWRNKSKDAIYQDAKRKREKVVIQLLKKWLELGIEPEAVEIFVKTYLSEICEKLRSEYCREAKNDEID